MTPHSPTLVMFFASLIPSIGGTLHQPPACRDARRCCWTMSRATWKRWIVCVCACVCARVCVVTHGRVSDLWCFVVLQSFSIFCGTACCQCFGCILHSDNFVSALRCVAFLPLSPNVCMSLLESLQHKSFYSSASSGNKKAIDRTWQNTSDALIWLLEVVLQWAG